jgi:hypothetical protein
MASDAYDRVPFLPILHVRLAAGGELSFQVVDIYPWLDALGEAIALNPVKRTLRSAT